MNTDKIYAESIVNEYSLKETSKVMALKKLDRRAKRGANIFTYCFGVVSSLLLGTGMCLCMEQISFGEHSFLFGIVIGAVGIIGCSVNFSIYKAIKKSGMKKYAADILALAKDISEEK